MTRTPRLLAVSVVAALALTGCGDALGQGGAAATVGDERISTGALEALVSRSLADPTAQQSVGADRAGFQRAALRRLINHLVVTEAARREGVSVAGADVDKTLDTFAEQSGGLEALTTQAKGQGIAEVDLRAAVADVATTDLIADKLTADVDVPEADLQKAYQDNNAQYDKVRSSHILVATKAKADEVLAKVKADPDSFATLAKELSTDTGSKDKGGDLGYQPRGALEKNFENAIFDNKPGSYVIAKTQFGFHVIHVVDRQTTTFEQARVQLRRGVLGQQRQTAVQELLAKVAADLGIDVNPRFGTWDAKTQQVVALDGNGVTKASPRPGDDASAAPTAAP